MTIIFVFISQTLLVRLERISNWQWFATRDHVIQRAIFAKLQFNNTACTDYFINIIPLHAILIVHPHVMIGLETMYLLYFNR